MVITSAHLRWSLLVDDHPTTPPPTFDVVTDPPVPPEVADHTGPWCQATIAIPGRPPAVAARPLSGVRKGDTAAWRRRCTEVLGDALEIAGYPPELDDLKLLARWRQRKAAQPAIHAPADEPASPADPADPPTVEAVLASLGTRRPALEAWARDQGLWPPGIGDVDRLLAKAAELAADEVFVGPETQPASPGGTDPVAEAREFLASVGASVPEPEPVAVDDDLAAEMDLLDERLADVDPELIARMAAFCEERGFPDDLSAMHRHEIEQLLDWLVAEGVIEDDLR